MSKVRRTKETVMNDSAHNGELVFRPLPQTVIEANVNPQELSAAYASARNKGLEFWADAARELDWFRPWNAVLDSSRAPRHTWFPGGQCNIVHNALDRHILTVNKNKLALIWEGEAGDGKKYTYYELYREVNRLANALRSLGVSRGDRVVLYMPPIPQTVTAMLACAKIGAIHCGVFSGFSAKVLRQRVAELGAKLVFTADGFYRNGRLLPLKATVDEALMSGCSCVETVIVACRANLDVDMSETRDVWYEAIIRQERPESATEVMNADDPLFILHTADSTGESKGVIHGHGGYMVGLHRTMDWIFDIKPTDIFWCTGDMAWIIGHSYAVYGPLVAGTTTVMYEGHPLYPQADRIWDMVDRHGVTILYTAPTIIRMLMRYGGQYPHMHDLSTLRLLATAGEGISREAWLWLHRHAGRSQCPVLDTWWQLETGACMIAPLPVSALKPGSVHRPLPGIEADIVDSEGQAVPPGKKGGLVLTRPWPSMLLGLYRKAELYEAAYWNARKHYRTGDTASRDEDGLIWVHGRNDGVMNIAGHRIGCAEVEKALMAHKAVAEAAVIGVPDKIKGEVGRAFIVLRPDFAVLDDRDEIIRMLKAHLRKEIGPVAVVRGMDFVDSLPKTDGAPDRAALRRKMEETEG
ncbi:acetyl-coenzyme A synthetase [Desulfomicrobium orale DSM 12838]|uniref:Acetate--CoA ligase n=2 Tax=Desulfomicrobium orale TaxID=132132 RepID=A0A109W5J9_9BACT|nr:acetyl-coenzyme A synthetase [Desulfomicrobium orale DSM 12838]